MPLAVRQLLVWSAPLVPVALALTAGTLIDRVFVGATPVGQDAANAPSNHSPKFFLDEGALKIGTESMLQAVLDFLGDSGR